MQLSFPVFFLEHFCGFLALRKVVKENSAVSFGDPRGFLSCTAVIWLALTTMTHQTVNLFSHSESTASPTIKEEGVRQSVCAKMNISNCSIQVHFAALWESEDHIYFMANMSNARTALNKHAGWKTTGYVSTLCVVDCFWTFVTQQFFHV